MARHRSAYREPLTPAQVDWLREHRRHDYRRLDPWDVEQLTPEMVRHLRFRDLRDLTPDQLIQLADFPEDLARILPRDRVIAETGELFRSREALEHARSLVSVSEITQNASVFLHSPNSTIRDAAIYGVIEAAYENDSITYAGEPMLLAEALLREAGLEDVTTFNMGPLSNGRSNSNVQAVMVTEHSNPENPLTLLAFRGTKLEPKEWHEGVPNEDQYYNDIFVHLFGAADYILGHPVGSYVSSMDRFAAAAMRGDPENPADGIFDIIDREIADAEAQGVRPNIVISGHSYGADNAARMAYIVARNYPEYATDIQLVGFGPTPTLMVEEQLLIYRALMGPDSPYANIDIDRIPDRQQEVLLAQWREEMSERVYKYRGQRDPFSIFTAAMQFFSLDNPDSMGLVRGDNREGHLDYQAELVREAIAERAVGLVTNPNVNDDYARLAYLRARADLPREMDVNADEVIYLEKRGWQRIIRDIQVRRAHDAADAEREESGAEGEAPAILLDETGRSVAEPSPEAPTPPALEEGQREPLTLEVEEAGFNGDMDTIIVTPLPALPAILEEQRGVK